MKRHRLRNSIGVRKFNDGSVPGAVARDGLVGQRQGNFRKWELNAVILCQFESKRRLTFVLFHQIKRSSVRIGNLARFAEDHSQQLIDISGFRKGNPDLVQFLQLVARTWRAQFVTLRSWLPPTVSSTLCSYFCQVCFTFLSAADGTTPAGPTV